MSSKLGMKAGPTTINKENWQEKSRKLKEQFPHLSDNDLEYAEGKIENLINKLHSRIGKALSQSKDGLLKFIEEL